MSSNLSTTNPEVGKTDFIRADEKILPPNPKNEMTDIRAFYCAKKTEQVFVTCKICDDKMPVNGHRTYCLPCGFYCKACLDDKHDGCKCETCKEAYGHDDCDFCKEEEEDNGKFECEICGEIGYENDYAGCCNDGDCEFGHERLCWGCCEVDEETGVPTCKKCIEKKEEE